MPKNLKVLNMTKCIGCLTCMITCAAANQKSHSLQRAALNVKTSGGLSGKFVAFICRACREERACAQACPSGALEERPGGGVIFHEERCLGCQRCQHVCAAAAINFDASARKPLICKHCGLCARFCPHNCLAMEEVDA